MKALVYLFIWLGWNILVSGLSGGFGKVINKQERVYIPPSDDAKCPCHSNKALPLYKDCCKVYHIKIKQSLSPEELIISRFSAYASGNVDYIIETTSKKSVDYDAYIEQKSYETGIQKWKKDLRANMIDNYQYIKIEVVSVNYLKDDQAEVTQRFLAIDRDGIRYPIEETSFVEKNKVDNLWYYIRGNVHRPPADVAPFMNDWPQEVGITVKEADDIDEKKSLQLMKGPGAKKPAKKGKKPATR